jgi:hypothetical protein
MVSAENHAGDSVCGSPPLGWLQVNHTVEAAQSIYGENVSRAHLIASAMTVSNIDPAL